MDIRRNEGGEGGVEWERVCGWRCVQREMHSTEGSRAGREGRGREVEGERVAVVMAAPSVDEERAMVLTAKQRAWLWLRWQGR